MSWKRHTRRRLGPKHVISAMEEKMHRAMVLKRFHKGLLCCIMLNKRRGPLHVDPQKKWHKCSDGGTVQTKEIFSISADTDICRFKTADYLHIQTICRYIYIVHISFKYPGSVTMCLLADLLGMQLQGKRPPICIICKIGF